MAARGLGRRRRPFPLGTADAAPARQYRGVSGQCSADGQQDRRLWYLGRVLSTAATTLAAFLPFHAFRRQRVLRLATAAGCLATASFFSAAGGFLTSAGLFSATAGFFASAGFLSAT